MKIAEVDNIKSFSLRITGLVQGVGFRPFVYNLARSLQLNGSVKNTNMNVEIVIEGEPSQIELFLSKLQSDLPEAAEIQNIESKAIGRKGYKNFEIEISKNLSDSVTQVSPDIAVCEHCLNDLKKQHHRIKYPFINCTDCGPRFTIIKSLPYDRPNTTMDVFEMCGKCAEEYQNITDKRFHAQPISCNSCGPQYRLLHKNKIISDFSGILDITTKIIQERGVMAIKGLGGFHLMCDAQNEEAVAQVRAIKKRDEKPFAVLFKDIDSVKSYCKINEIETGLLTSKKRPVVILDSQKSLAKGVSGELNTIGALLPYMPIHYLLFEELETDALVLTSANLSGNPILINNEIVVRLLNDKVEAILDYNRDIHNRTDDSVCQAVGNEKQVLRRSRGYVPQPIMVDSDVEGIMASGAELVNCFCIGKDNQAILSQHIGDLKNFETFQFYEETFNRFKSLFKFEPKVVAHDLHPDYLSTRFALKLPGKHIGIQHHHAHVAAVMAEHHLNEKVIGVCLDGTGYGTDGNIWGGEFFTCDFVESKRESHFQYVDLPGGDKTSEEPWRMAASYLKAAYGNDWADLDIPVIKELKNELAQFDLFAKMLSTGNPIKTSSAGRLFDAIAALTGLCKHAAFHAQAPMYLENVADRNENGHYRFETADTLSFLPTIEDIVNDIIKNVSTKIISARFHNTLVEAIFQKVVKIHKKSGLQKVILSGGCFQNKILLHRLTEKLKDKGFLTFTGNNIPVNDGGVALGQLVIAANRTK